MKSEMVDGERDMQMQMHVAFSQLNDGGDCGIVPVPLSPFAILSRRAKMTRIGDRKGESLLPCRRNRLWKPLH